MSAGVSLNATISFIGKSLRYGFAENLDQSKAAGGPILCRSMIFNFAVFSRWECRRESCLAVSRYRHASIVDLIVDRDV